MNVGFCYYLSKCTTFCGVPGSPCLSKTGLILARIFQFLVVCQYVCAWLTTRVSSRPGAMVVLWRPRPTGTRQYYMLSFYDHSGV